MANSRCGIAATVAAAIAASLWISSPTARAQIIPDLVSKTSFRVCSDPANLPFSNRQQQGFENKIAEIFGKALDKPVRYFWAPSGPGFIRNTLNDDFCDVVLGYTLGSDIVLPTNPYYRSTYVIVAPKSSPLNGVESIDDPRLKNHRIGVFAATAPVDLMLARGLITQATVYPLLVDHRFDSPLTTLLGDLEAKKIDAAIIWGPLVGESVKQSNGALVMTPLLKDADKPGFSYRISLGVRHDETQWKHKLDDILKSHAAEIDKVLVAFNVPLLDNAGHLIPPNEAETGTPKLQPATDHGDRGRRGPMPVPGGFKMPGPPPTNAQ